MNEQLEKQLRDAHETFARDHERLRGELLVSLAEAVSHGQAPRRPPIVRRLMGEIAMRTTWTKLTAAAAIILAVGIAGTVFLQNSATPAYAIEQTLEANKGVRFVHIKCTPSGGGVGEAWAEFSEDGELLRLRMNFPEPPNGPKQVVWQEDKATVYSKDKNILMTLREREVLEKLKGMRELFDPKVMMAAVSHWEATGRATIETIEPEDEDEPITLIVTSTPEPTSRQVCLVDRESKLLIEMERFRLRGEEYISIDKLDYSDYDKPVDDKIFTLDVPDDVDSVDQTRSEVGLVKGDLSDEEIAAEVVRQFFEALIAEDYAGAGKLVEGLPGDFIKKKVGTTRFLRIVSIGTPEPMAKRYGPGATRVPCKIEVQEDDGNPIIKDYEPWVRAVYGQLDRRTIFGNF